MVFKKKAFTLIELLVAITIIAILFLALINIFTQNFKNLKKIKDLDAAHHLAIDLKEEILSKPFVLKKNVSHVKKLNLTNNSRIDFETVYDYQNYYASRPCDILGNKLNQYKDFSVKINLISVIPDKYNNIILSNEKTNYVSFNIEILKNSKPLFNLPFIVTN